MMDPVMEVKLWQEQQRIQDRILARKNALLLREQQNCEKQRSDVMDVEFKEAAPVISLVSDENVSDDSEATMDYPDDTTAIPIPVATTVVAAVPVATPADIDPARFFPIVPKTIQDLWQSVERMPLPLESPRCTCKQCPYTSGPLMAQRYDLMQRLVELERQLYGI